MHVGNLASVQFEQRLVLIFSSGETPRRSIFQIVPRAKFKSKLPFERASVIC